MGEEIFACLGEHTVKGIIGVLFLLGVVVLYWKWIVAVVLVVLIVRAAPVAYRELQAERSADRARLQRLIARADQQHRWAMAGDERGIYGDYPPPAIVTDFAEGAARSLPNIAGTC